MSRVKVKRKKKMSENWKMRHLEVSGGKRGYKRQLRGETREQLVEILGRKCFVVRDSCEKKT